MKKNQSGISLVEVLISLGILGGTAFVVMNGSDIQRKSKDVKEKLEVSVEANRDSLEGFRNVLFDTGNLHNEGICKLIKKDIYAAPPVGAININLSGLQGILNDTGRIKKYLPLWKPSEEAGCSSDNIKCLTLDESNKSITPELLKLKPLLKIAVTPVYMNPQAGGLFESINKSNYSNDMDVKNVGFKFKSTLEINIENKPKIIKNLETFEWTGQVGYCKKGNQTLSFSGMEFVEGSDVIFNRQGFATNKEAPFNVAFRQTVAQSGKYDSSGKYIFTDQTKSIATSCKETSFRCRQELSGQRDYNSDLGVIADIEYVTPNALTSGSSLLASIFYKIKKGDNGSSFSNEEIDTYIGSNVDCSVMVPLSEGSCEKTNSYSKTMYGDNIISVAMWDKDKTNSSTSLCNKICDKDTNYNFPNNDSKQAYSGYLSLEVTADGGATKKTYEYQVSDKIGCTACFMKNCDQFGIGTFGAMNEMPYQPLDSQIPECAIHEPKKVLYDSMPYKGNSIGHNNTNLCVSAKLNSTSDGLIYSLKNCGEKLAVMCFAYGKFLLARDIGSSASTFSKVSYGNSAERCFKMGHETVDKKKLDDYISGTEKPNAESNNYDFYNLAQQGLFIAPQIPEDIKTFKAWLETQGHLEGEFWVALETKSMNSFDVRVPLIPSFVDSKEDAVYFNGTKQLTYTKISQKIPASVVTGKGYGVLFHNIKYKGVRLYKKIDPFGGGFKLPFLCRKKDGEHYEIFKSKGTSDKIIDGPDKCEEENGLFLPPITSYEWVKALTVVDPISKKHSFPEIGSVESYKDFKMAWVAIEAEVSAGSEVDWEPYSSKHLENNFLSINYFDPGINSSYKLNNSGEYVNNTLKTSENVISLKSENAISGSFSSPPGFLAKIHMTYNFNKHFSIEMENGLSAKQVEEKMINAISSDASLAGKIKVSFDDVEKKIKIEALDGKKLYIYDSKVTEFLNLKTGEDLVIRKMCLSNDKKIMLKGYNENCENSSEISRRDFKSKSFKVLWSLHEFKNKTDMVHYVFE